jgi:hypothetical protein
MKKSMIRLHETNCASFLGLESQASHSEENLIDLKKCNTKYTATTIDPETNENIQANVDLKCFPAV